MQRELDKIDRFAAKIVEQAKLSQSASSKLTKEVQVSNLLAGLVKVIYNVEQLVFVCIVSV